MKLITILLGSMLALSGEVFTGVITDSMCNMKHESMNMKPDDKCVRECQKHGDTKYVLWDGNKAYKLSDQKTPEKFAAQKVKITGKLYAKTGIIAVDKIEAAK